MADLNKINDSLQEIKRQLNYIYKYSGKHKYQLSTTSDEYYIYITRLSNEGHLISKKIKKDAYDEEGEIEIERPQKWDEPDEPWDDSPKDDWGQH
tara:strand:- start:407 stop:691 length:285 start_codon:yes stop_codon:yes gene_type:complete